VKRPSYPTREASRFDHALLCPLRGLPFEQVELIRADLFEYLDFLTTALYASKAAEALFAAKDAEIEHTADRLKEVMRYRSKVTIAGVKAGTIDSEVEGTEDEITPRCGPFSLPVWEECLDHCEHRRG
jgi:hypothetical protein